MTRDFDPNPPEPELQSFDVYFPHNDYWSDFWVCGVFAYTYAGAVEYAEQTILQGLRRQTATVNIRGEAEAEKIIYKDGSWTNGKPPIIA